MNNTKKLYAFEIVFALYWDNSNENADGQASYLCKISKTKTTQGLIRFIHKKKESSYPPHTQIRAWEKKKVTFLHFAGEGSNKSDHKMNIKHTRLAALSPPADVKKSSQEKEPHIMFR